jgi:hypothetical protein
MIQVFLSHSKEDSEFATRLASDLRMADIPVWKAPESILPGEGWVEALQRGLSTSTHMVLLMSPAAVHSRWVNFEFSIALDLNMRGNIRIVPIEYLPCEPPPFWRHFQAIVGFGNDYDANISKLRSKLHTEQPPKPPAAINRPRDVSRTMNVAGGNATFSDRPKTPPHTVSTPQSDQKHIDIDQSTILSWPAVFQDDFSSNKNGWPIGDFVNEHVINRFQLVENHFQWTAETRQDNLHWAVVCEPIPFVTNFHFSVEGQMIGGSGYHAFGFLFGLADWNNFFDFQISDDGSFFVWVRHKGDWELIAHGLSDAINDSGSNNPSVLVKDKNISLFVNRKQVYSFDDSRLKPGKVGMALRLGTLGNSMTVQFSNLRLLSPDRITSARP